ncbi:unnamed protein product [Camellia sinensis]
MRSSLGFRSCKFTGSGSTANESNPKSRNYRYGTLTGSRKGEVSRQEYLKKMEQKKLKELRDDIEDEQYLFDGVKLTEVEYGELSGSTIADLSVSITRVENYQLPPDAPPLTPLSFW